MELQGTNVAAGIVPYTDQDKYWTHWAKYGKGGLRTVPNEAARLSVPTELREEYMEVTQADTGVKYRLLPSGGWEPSEGGIEDAPSDGYQYTRGSSTWNRNSVLSFLNRWQGGKINFIGDSITYGAHASDADHAYVNVVKELLGLITARNYGIPGSTISQTPQTSTSFIASRFVAMENDADGIFVLAGVNDYILGVTIGDSNLDNLNVNTFNGALNVLISGLIDKYPDKYIYFATPLWSNKYEQTEITDFINYVNAIKERCAAWGVPCLDLTTDAQMNARILSQKNALMPDGLHPNDVGHERMAKIIALYLTSPISTAATKNVESIVDFKASETNIYHLPEASSSTITIVSTIDGISTEFLILSQPDSWITAVKDGNNIVIDTIVNEGAEKSGTITILQNKSNKSISVNVVKNASGDLYVFYPSKYLIVTPIQENIRLDVSSLNENSPVGWNIVSWPVWMYAAKYSDTIIELRLYENTNGVLNGGVVIEQEVSGKQRVISVQQPVGSYVNILPIFTSNNTPSPLAVTATFQWATTRAYMTLDHSAKVTMPHNFNDDGWYVNTFNQGVGDESMTLDVGAPITFSKIGIRIGGGFGSPAGYSVSECEVSGSTDGVNWDVLAHPTDIDNSGLIGSGLTRYALKVINLFANKTYRYFKVRLLKSTVTPTMTYCILGSFELYI